MSIESEGANNMNKKTVKVLLSEKDKNIISQNANICTDTHGKGCNDLANINNNNNNNKKLN
jgi:hypothetical protein